MNMNMNIHMNIPIDVVIKIIAYVDMEHPCMTITWSCVCKRLYAVFHQTSRDWRLSKRGMWTRFFVKHRDKIEWSHFLNVRVLPRQLERRDPMWRVCEISKRIWEVEHAPMNVIIREIDKLKNTPQFVSYLARRHLTEQEWERLAEFGVFVPIGQSCRMSAEWMLAHAEHVTALVIKNKHVRDDVAARFMSIVDLSYSWEFRSSHRSDEFYAMYPHTRAAWGLVRPIKWWRAQNMSLDEMAACSHLPPEIIMEHVDKWTEDQYDDLFEYVQMDCAWLDKLNARRTISRFSAMHIQPIEWFDPSEYENNADLLRALSQNPNITPEWVEKYILPMKYPRECWEEITCNYFGLDPLI